MDYESPPTPPVPSNEPPENPPGLPSEFPPNPEPNIAPESPSARNVDHQPEARARSGGAARERYERRRQQATPAKSNSTRRQITVPQNINLPKIPGGTLTLIGVVGAVAFVILVVYVLGRVRNNALETQPNALWLGTEWSYDDHTDDQIAALVTKLRDQHIGTVYAYVSYLQFNGAWRNEDKFDKVKA
ncbi:MAG: hypothetical protein ABI700_28040, partial [Chloroflexota bacterium]